jgi:hypothetical protein
MDCSVAASMRSLDEGMRAPGLSCCVWATQAASCSGIVGHRAGAEVEPAADMREVGAEAALLAHAAHRVAGVAAVREEGLAAAFDVGRTKGGRRRGFACAASHAHRTRRAFRHHVQRHARMLLAAVFGALAAVGAGAVGLQQQVLHAAGQHVHLAAERGHPEAVDHVGAAQAEVHGPADRNADLVGGRDLRAGRRVAVAHLPPPHVRGDADDERVLRRHGPPGRPVPFAVREQRDQHDGRKHDAAADHPQPCVQRAVVPARRQHQQRHHAEKDHRRADRDQQAGDAEQRVGHRPRGLQCGLRWRRRGAHSSASR